jgi:hypothetical protein
MWTQNEALNRMTLSNITRLAGPVRAFFLVVPRRTDMHFLLEEI